MKLILIFSITLFFVVSIFGQHENSHRKNFYLITLQKMTWFESLQYCRSIGMKLVSIESQAENDRIILQILNEGHSEKWFWTSGTKFGYNGIYKWVGNGKTVTYTNWAPGQPDNLFSSNEREDCINIFGTDGGGVGLKWNDHLCSTKLDFICEDEPNNAVLVPNRKEKYYHLITLAQVDWFKALQHCQYIGMKLISIESPEENDQIIGKILNDGQEKKWFWTSGTKMGNNGVYRWMGSGRNVTFTNWAPGQPDNLFYSNEQEDCINIFGTDRGGVGSKWNDHLCSTQLNFICEQEPSVKEDLIIIVI